MWETFLVNVRYSYFLKFDHLLSGMNAEIGFLTHNATSHQGFCAVFVTALLQAQQDGVHVFLQSMLTTFYLSPINAQLTKY